MNAEPLGTRWQMLCERYLLIKFEDSLWRYNRKSRPREPSQGWKLHLSATILEACDLFERVAPFLTSEDVQFKAPGSLDDLSNLNCGLMHGYHQVGKFITIYPSTEKKAVRLARRLHEMTKEFSPISIPFDEQYLPGSSVFYRYGGFSKIELTDENGDTFLAIKNPSGEFVPDDRLRAVPEWLSDPFPKNGKGSERTFAGTPLGTTYRIFRAITQRGKGGTYEAVDLSQPLPRLCIVKEGRKNGELGWNGQDGYFLVRNEFEVLTVLKEKYDAVPEVFSSFDVYGDFYFAMEHVGGKTLKQIMIERRRRFSIQKVIGLAIEIAQIVEKIHRAGWVWNDCKPANLIIAKSGAIRPVDFENAFPVNGSAPFDWKTKGFSKTTKGKKADIYALGAVVYFLLTGRLYEPNTPVEIAKLRRNIPQSLLEITEKLLSESFSDVSDARKEFEKISLSL